MPLEPGESPPLIRRRVGTTYQLPENLIKNANNKDESVTDLELQIQLHANMAEAALGLANEQNISKVQWIIERETGKQIRNCCRRCVANTWRIINSTKYSSPSFKRSWLQWKIKFNNNTRLNSCTNRRKNPDQRSKVLVMNVWYGI